MKDLQYVLKRVDRLNEKISKTSSALDHVKQVGDEVTINLLTRSLRSSKQALKRWKIILEAHHG